MQNQCEHSPSFFLLHLQDSSSEETAFRVDNRATQLHREPVSSLGTAFLLLPNMQSKQHPGLGLGGRDRLQEPDSKGSDLAKRDLHRPTYAINQETKQQAAVRTKISQVLSCRLHRKLHLTRTSGT